ncbi:hypothetical protein [uncultured Paracoccus sp.]|uniref:hypothetical protein n=1 Tax=uncultured Paracoccus sp. TaxID=189685 RepID=UPI0025F0F66D|nr:hypothetical protein [uncultured Paracoccus sp.]
MTFPTPADYAETERLKDRVRGCRTQGDLAAALAAIAGPAKVQEAVDRGGIIQLRNLIQYQRKRIDRGWVSHAATGGQP